MKEKLKELVDQALPEIITDLGLSSSLTSLNYDVELPRVKTHGDLSINLAFQIGRLLKKNPYEIAQKCQSVLNRQIKEPSWIQEITVEKPGFINFRLTERFYAEILPMIKKEDEKFGKTQTGSGSKVIIEFVSANPTGPLTIAHGRQAAIGDTLGRILSAVGHKVHKEFYLNDAGRQIRLLGESLWVRYQELHGIKDVLPEEGYQGSYLIELAKRLQKEKKDALIKAGKDKNIEFVTNYAVSHILDGIKEDLKKTGVSFDEYFSESSLTKNNLVHQILELLKKKGLSYESEGALWFRSTDFGDDKDRVLRKQTGEFTYLTPDIAYHQSKFQRGFQKLINLWGPDHHGYVPRLKAACQALGYQADQLKVLIVQLTTLYRKGEPVRMSTRTGEFVTLKELVDEVGVDATRFFFLMRKIESHLDFDLELAKQKSDENPVFYVQYAHARISSILAFAQRNIDLNVNLSFIREQEAIDLIKKMAEFPEAVKQAAEILEPYRIVDYLRDLASAFHKFYTFHRIVGDDEELTKARLLLTDCTRIVLRNGLALLGVLAPSKM